MAHCWKSMYRDESWGWYQCEDCQVIRRAKSKNTIRWRQPKVCIAISGRRTAKERLATIGAA